MMTEHPGFDWKAVIVSLVVMTVTTPLRSQTPTGQVPSAQAPVMCLNGWQRRAARRNSMSRRSSRDKSSDSKLTQQTPLRAPGDYYVPNGGLFSARDWPLTEAFIYFRVQGFEQPGIFAYAQLPEWTRSDRYDIEARSGRPQCHQRPNAADLSRNLCLADCCKASDPL